MKQGCIKCPYHGWEFDGSGACVRIPSAAEGTPIPPRSDLATVHCAERYGLVRICPGQPRADIPHITHEDDKDYRRINTPVQTWTTSAGRMVDNFCDVSHFPFVHPETFGDSQDPTVGPVELRALDDHFYGYSYEVEVANDALGSTASGQGDGVVQRRMTTGFNLAFSVRSTIHYHTGLHHILLLLSTPVDDVTSLFTFVVWRNDDFSLPTQDVIRLDLAIGAEDKRMLERVSGMLPLGQTSLVSVQADRCSVEWRRRLRELIEPTSGLR